MGKVARAPWVALTALAASCGASIPSASSAPPAPGSVSSFVSLARAGTTGTFEATYAVKGPIGSGTVELAQRAARGVSPFPTGKGEWTFLFRNPAGSSSQWIEQGATALACTRQRAARWQCGGPGRFYGSNGYVLATEPFVPAVILGDLNELGTGLRARRTLRSTLSLTHPTSRAFGRLTCLHASRLAAGEPVTACLDAHGFLVSLTGDSWWLSIRLISYRHRPPPPALFKLVAPVSSPDLRFMPI